MARMRPPIVPEQPVPVVPDDGLRRLLATCAGKDFDARRDTALILYFLDTGARRSEAAALQLADLDFDYQVTTVLGKGRRTRELPFGRKTALALDRYLRARAVHRHADLPWLWLGQRGRLTAYGIQQVIRRRGQEAGLPGLHPHQLRHTFCHQWRAEVFRRPRLRPLVDPESGEPPGGLIAEGIQLPQVVQEPVAVASNAASPAP
jgi:site-specific recombinase XerC